MTDQDANLILEYLKRFQSGQSRIERKLEEVVIRLGQVELSVSGLRRGLAHVDESVAAMGVRIDRLDARVERIEKRLELA